MYSLKDFIYSEHYIKYKYNLLKHMGYTPGPAQKLVHNSFARFRTLGGGARFGKSIVGGAEAAVRVTLPGQRIWLIGPQYSLAEKEFMWAADLLGRVKLNDFGGRSLLSFCKVTTNSKGSRRIQTRWGSFIETKTVEKPQSLFGESLTMAVLCEAAHIKMSVYQKMIRARLGDLKGDIFASSTPNKNSGLLHTFNLRGKSKESTWKDWESWNFGVIDNPTFSREEIECARRELPKKIFDEQYGGLYFDPREKVISTFFENEHVVDSLPEMISHLPIFVGIKRAFNNPMAILFMAYDKKENITYVFDEKYGSMTTIKAFEQEIKTRLIGKRFCGFVTAYKDFNTQNELKALGLYYSEHRPANNVKSDEVHLFDKLRESFTEERIVIFSGCKGLIGDLTNYRFDETEQDDDKMQHEIPKKSTYKQGVDALAQVNAMIERTKGNY